jgi:hypothetical protein
MKSTIMDVDHGNAAAKKSYYQTRITTKQAPLPTNTSPKENHRHQTSTTTTKNSIDYTTTIRFMLHYSGVNKWKSQPQNNHRTTTEQPPKKSTSKKHYQNHHPFTNNSNHHWTTTSSSATAMKSTSQKHKHRTMPKKDPLEEAPNKHTSPSPSDGKLTFDYIKSNSTAYQWNAQAESEFQRTAHRHTITHQKASAQH